MVKESSYSIADDAAAKAVDELRRMAQANDLTRSRMAEAIGVSRPTLNTRFVDGDMKLTEFLRLAAAAEQKPSQVMKVCDGIIGRAIRKTKKAPVTTGAMPK